MNSPYRRTHRVTPTGVATASILLVSLLMAASLLFEQPEPNPSSSTNVVQATAHVRG
jgi:hypothetical protein